jgi:putative DNA primase/helicase
MNAAEIARRFGLKRQGREWRGTCPNCGYPNGFAVSERAGRALWWCASCRDQAALTHIVGGGESRVSEPRTLAAADRPDRRAAALALWNAAQPAEGSPVEDYLAGRRLALRPGAPIRFISRWHDTARKSVPAMIARMDDVRGSLVAVHITFLHRGERHFVRWPEKADARRTRGDVAGAAIRLAPEAPHIVVAEGIETALAAAALLALPPWAFYSAGNLENEAALPAAVREVTIAADNDPQGREAAREAARRWRAEGRKVRIALPDREGADFADVLAEAAA